MTSSDSDGTGVEQAHGNIQRTEEFDGEGRDLGHEILKTAREVDDELLGETFPRLQQEHRRPLISPRHAIAEHFEERVDRHQRSVRDAKAVEPQHVRTKERSPREGLLPTMSRIIVVMQTASEWSQAAT
jgi:hypothetical protein